MSGVNYFFALTTIISPDQRQLLFDPWAARSARRRAGAKPARGPVFVLELHIHSGRWESGKPAFGFPLSHPPSPPELWKCGNLAAFGRDSQGARGKRGKPVFGFPRFPQSRHFHSSRAFRFCPVASRRSSSLTLSLVFRLLFLLGVFHPVARDVQLDDHAMMHQSVDRCRRHHRVFEDRFPF